MVFKEYFLQTINCLSVIKATKKIKNKVVENKTEEERKEGYEG